MLEDEYSIALSETLKPHSYRRCAYDVDRKASSNECLLIQVNFRCDQNWQHFTRLKGL